MFWKKLNKNFLTIDLQSIHYSIKNGLFWMQIVHNVIKLLFNESNGIMFEDVTYKSFQIKTVANSDEVQFIFEDSRPKKSKNEN